MSSPQAPAPPKAPDYGAANREGIVTDIETLAARRAVEQAAKLGEKVTYQMPIFGKGGEITGYEERTVDFTGKGDSRLQEQQVESALSSSRRMAEGMLALQNEFGDEYIKKSLQQLELSDPEGTAARKALFKSVMDDFAKGGELDDQTARQIEQDIRGAQARRGNLLGTAPTAQEVMGKGDARLRLKQQRLANVGAALAGSTPTAQFQSIAGAQSGATPFMPVAMPTGTNINAGAGNAAAQFALNRYGTRANIWQTQAQIKAAEPTLLDQIGQGVGIFGNLMGGVASAAAI